MQPFDTEEEALTLIEATLGKGKEAWDGRCETKLGELQDRELTSMLLDLDNLDEWMNDHLVTQVIAQAAPFSM